MSHGIRQAPRRTPRPRFRGTTWTAAAVLALTLGVGGCSGDDDQKAPRSDRSASSSPAAPAPSARPITTKVVFGKVSGRLPRPARERVHRQVQRVVDGWVDAAYLGGDYPRASFPGAFAAFTPGVRARARRDADLLTNADIGRSIDGVRPGKRVVRIDVLAPRRRPVGVTARVMVRFTTSGAKARRVQVLGRLYLTKHKGGWQVFGYDVSKDLTAAKGGAS